MKESFAYQFFLALTAGIIGGAFGTAATLFLAILLLGEGSYFTIGASYNDDIPVEQIHLDAYEVREGGLYVQVTNNAPQEIEFLMLRVAMRKDGKLVRSEELHIDVLLPPAGHHESVEKIIDSQSGDFLDLTAYENLTATIEYAGVW
jgi:hypothetical protein